MRGELTVKSTSMTRSQACMQFELVSMSGNEGDGAGVSLMQPLLASSIAARTTAGSNRPSRTRISAMLIASQDRARFPTIQFCQSLGREFKAALFIVAQPSSRGTGHRRMSDIRVDA